MIGTREQEMVTLEEAITITKARTVTTDIMLSRGQVNMKAVEER